MKTQFFILLLLISFTNQAREYDFHWEIGKRSEGQLKAQALAPELDGAATTILTSSIRINKDDLVLEKVLKGEVRNDNFTMDEAQFIYSKSLFLSSVLKNHGDDKELLKEFETLMKPVADYNRLHLKVRHFFANCQDCTQDEVDCSLQEILSEFDSEKLMADLEKIKVEIIPFKLRIKRSIQAKK